MKDHFHFHLIQSIWWKEVNEHKVGWCLTQLSFFEGVARDQRGGRANGDERTELWGRRRPGLDSYKSIFHHLWSYMINDHIYVTNIITVIKTQEGQMINTDEETSNENLQKKVNHCVRNFEEAFKIIKKILTYLFLDGYTDSSCQNQWFGHISNQDTSGIWRCLCWDDFKHMTQSKIMPKYYSGGVIKIHPTRRFWLRQLSRTQLWQKSSRSRRMSRNPPLRKRRTRKEHQREGNQVVCLWNKLWPWISVK